MCIQVDSSTSFSFMIKYIGRHNICIKNNDYIIVYTAHRVYCVSWGAISGCFIRKEQKKKTGDRTIRFLRENGQGRRVIFAFVWNRRGRSPRPSSPLRNGNKLLSSIIRVGQPKWKKCLLLCFSLYTRYTVHYPSRSGLDEKNCFIIIKTPTTSWTRWTSSRRKSV